MKEIKNWVVAYDADGEKDICRRISAFTRKEAEEEFARQVNIEFCTNIEMWEDTMGARLSYNQETARVEL